MIMEPRLRTLTSLPGKRFVAAPQRQIVVVLDGTLEVTTGDGATRRFGPGNAFLADDMASRGHLTRTIDGAAHVLFVPMPAEVDLDAWIAPA